jgi:hypothetical protein
MGSNGKIDCKRSRSTRRSAITRKHGDQSKVSVHRACASTHLQNDIGQTSQVDGSVGRASVHICETSLERFYTYEDMYRSLCCMFKMQCTITSLLVSCCAGDNWLCTETSRIVAEYGVGES